MPNISFPFWLTLSTETQDAYLIAESMKDTGLSIGRTAFNMSKGTWTGARLTTGLTRFSTVMTEWGVTSLEAEAVIANGLEVAAATTTVAETGVLMGALTAVGRWFGFKAAIAAGVAGVVVATVVLGGVTYVVANAAGEYSADDSVQEGQAMAGRTAPDGGIKSSSSVVPPPVDADVPQLDDESRQQYDEELQRQLGAASGGDGNSDDRQPSKARHARTNEEEDDDDGDDDDDDRDHRRKKVDDDDDHRSSRSRGHGDDDDDDDDHHSSRSSKHGDDDDDDDDRRSSSKSCSDDDDE